MLTTPQTIIQAIKSQPLTPHAMDRVHVLRVRTRRAATDSLPSEASMNTPHSDKYFKYLRLMERRRSRKEDDRKRIVLDDILTTPQ
jgi:hypothetical protein